MVEVSAKFDVEPTFTPEGVGLDVWYGDELIHSDVVEWDEVLDSIISDSLFEYDRLLNRDDHFNLCYIASGLKNASDRILAFVASRTIVS